MDGSDGSNVDDAPLHPRWALAQEGGHAAFVYGWNFGGDFPVEGAFKFFDTMTEEELSLNGLNFVVGARF